MSRRAASIALAMIPLVLLGAYYFFTTPTNGDFWWYDASRHAMNGVFLRDFVLEGGILHPIEFSSRYYQQYPGINIGFYPPFFYMSSVPMLMLFGTSHAVSQAVVALYTLGLGVVVCLLCRRMMDSLSASAIALCVLALAPVALWSRQVQLDVPALAIFVFAAYALIRHLDGGSQKWLFIAALAMGLGVLTRVQGVFMAPVWLYFIFVRNYPGRPPLGRRLLASVLAGLVALPAVAMAVYFARVNKALATAMPDMPTLWSWENWTWYAAQLPPQIGYPALAVLATGLVAAVWISYQRKANLEIKVIAAFGICAWIFFTVVSNKEPRFNMPGIVFLFLLGACAWQLASARLGRIVACALALGLICQLFVQPPVPFVRGFERAAELVAKAAPRSSNVLISAHRDGNFIYNLRTQGARRDIGVRRADKLLVQINIMRQLGIHDRKLTQEDILKILDRENVETVVFQTAYLSDQTSIQNLQELLEHSGHFTQAEIVPITGQTKGDEQQLVIYKRIRPATASS